MSLTARTSSSLREGTSESLCNFGRRSDPYVLTGRSKRSDWPMIAYKSGEGRWEA